MASATVKRAYTLVSKSLIHCATPIGIAAGTHHFVDLWARDSLFVTFGVNYIDKSYSQKTINTFVRYQREDGLIPYLVERSPATLAKYLGKPTYHKNPKPQFRSHQSLGLVLDGSLMTIIAFKEHFDRNQSLLRSIYPKLKNAIMWYIDRFKDNLLSEWFQCEWADAVLKIGKTLYTNVLYFKALTDMSDLARKNGNEKDALHFSQLSRIIQRKIQNRFWNGDFLADWIDYKRHDYFASHQNLLAAWFNLVDKEQAEKILQFASKCCLNDFTLEENYPSYPSWRIPLLQHTVGMKDYHNRGCLWLQPGLWYVACLKKFGFKRKAEKFFEQISRHILKYDGAHEVYEKDGRPVNRWFYKAEHPFAWSAGLYIYVANQLVQSA